MYYKHKDLDQYVMRTPTQLIKIMGDSVVQYKNVDYFFQIESDLNLDQLIPIKEHEFRFAFIQLLESLTHTLKTINHAEVTIN